MATLDTDKWMKPDAYAGGSCASSTANSPYKSLSASMASTSTRMSEKDRERERGLSDIVSQLRERVKDLPPLLDEPEYFLLDENLVRFIRAREYNLKEAEKQLRSTIEWRRKHRPLNIVCRGCQKKPGLHSIRQVGFDLDGRPVIYTCFSQCSSLKVTVESTVEHMVALCENSIASFGDNSPPSWSWVIDCHGVTLGCCNPNLAQEILNLLSLCYPEYLHRVILTNHNTIFHNFWKVIRVFIDPRSIEKVKFVRKREKLALCFEEMFPQELTDWLLEEIRLNSLDDIPLSQKQFYLPPNNGTAHDARGAPTYIRQYIIPFAVKFHEEQRLLNAGSVIPRRVHQPHPNICDYLLSHFTPSLSRKQVQEPNQSCLDQAVDSSNFSMVSPEQNLIREMIPSDRNSKGKASASTDQQSLQSQTCNGWKGNGQHDEAAASYSNLKLPMKNGNGSMASNSRGNGVTNGNGTNGYHSLDAASNHGSSNDYRLEHGNKSVLSNEQHSAVCIPTVEQRKVEVKKDVADTVIESITSATNRISTFFREFM